MNTEEREISLIDLLIYVAKGWRSILVWMLIMAIAVGGIQYVREIKAAKAYENTKPITQEEEKEQAISTIEQLRKEMPSEEIMAVNKVVRLEKDYELQNDYVKNSLLMTMNPYNVSIARLQYWINTDYKVNYAGTTKKDRTDAIVDSYVYSLEDSSWKKAALKAADSDIELQYFSEMVSINDLGDSFAIVIKYTDEAQLRKMITVLEEQVKSYQEKVEAIYGKHELSLVSESVEVTADNDVYNLQQARKSNLLNLENNIAAYKAAFNDKQKSLYTSEILASEEETEGAEQEQAAVEEVYPTVPPTPQIRVKYILLGAILGAFFVCLVRAMQYILSGKLKVEDNVTAYLGVPGLGCIEENPREVKGAFGKLDAWIDGLSKRNFANLTKEQQLKMTVSNISLYCEKDNLKNIYFNSSVNCIEKKAGELIQKLEEKGIEVKNGFSILQDAAAMEDMSRADAVVFVEQAGKSQYEDLEREIKLCKEHGKTVIGLVVLS